MVTVVLLMASRYSDSNENKFDDALRGPTLLAAL